MASIQNSFDLRNPYTTSGMVGGQPNVFSQTNPQPPQSTPQPVPQEPDFLTGGATDYSISSSTVPRPPTTSTYPLQQLMQQSSKATNDMVSRKSSQPDFLSDLSGFVGNGVNSGEFVTSPSLQAAAALAAHHRQQQHPLYRPFSTDVPSPPPSAGRLRSPPFGSSGPPRNNSGSEGDPSLGDSRSLGALLREIAGVPSTTAAPTIPTGVNRIGAGGNNGNGPVGRMMDMPRYDNPGISSFGGEYCQYFYID